MRDLRKGTESNVLHLVVEDLDIKPYADIRFGTGLELKLSRYNIEDLLIQLLEEYGEEGLIKRIKAID